MNKHKSINDLLKLIIIHRDELEKIQNDKGSLSTIDLVKVFTISVDTLASSFTYVFGSMKGSQDLQYSNMLNNLKKKGHISIAEKLRQRKELPCIDIQESIWLLNKNSKRDRSRDWGYNDYNEFKNKQLVSGKASNFHIDWNIVDDIAG